MKRQRRVGKAVMALFLAVLLVLQTVMFSVAALADEIVPDQAGTAAVSEEGSPNVAEPVSVPEAVYETPNQLTAAAAEPSDKTAVLMEANQPFPLEVSQDGTALNTGDTIQGRKPFTLKSDSIRVPVKGDYDDPDSVDGSTVILHGDSVMLDRATYFPEVILPTATQTLKDKSGYPIGTAYLSEAGIRVVFDGEERFFNGQGVNINFGFESTAKADVSGIEYGTQKPIDIFGKGYMLDNPDKMPLYGLTLKSTSNTADNGWITQADFVAGTIEWQAEVTATDQFDPTIPLPLDGLKFYNALDPAQVGTYVDGSLKINGSAVTPDSNTANALAYTFPEGFGDKAIITYKTWIPKAKYYTEYNTSSGNQTVSNTAELRDGSDSKLLSSNVWRVIFRPDWIQHSGTLDKRSSSNDPRTITWTIDVNTNYSKQGLKGLTITDALPNGLTWKSAAWQAWDSTKKAWSEVATPISPDNNVYSFGDVDGPIRLVIVSEVTGSQTGFTNNATARWNLDVNTVQNNDQGTAAGATVTIGAHSLSLTGGGDLALGTASWKATLTPQEALPDGAVYDLLVYGDASSIDFSKVTVPEDLPSGILDQLKGSTRTNYYQRFRAGSFNSNDGLTYQVYTLQQDGKPVADLLRVTGYDTDAAATFTFDTLLTKWEHFAANSSTIQYNQVSLFEGTTRTVDSNRASATFNSGVLAKEMLFASKPNGTGVTPNNVGSYIRNDTNEEYTLAAYDRVTKTVTFRLSVNMNGMRTEDMAKDGGNHVAKDIQLVDTLPESWEFVPYSEGKDFAIYKGNRADYGATVSASALIADPSNLVSFSAAGNIGTFSFAKLESPYVILVKARPSVDALRQYFEAGEVKHAATNTAELKITWGDEPTTATSTRKVIVPMQTLSKSVTKPNPGVLEWTVNYTPPFEVNENVYLQDTLGEGLALRKDGDGNLSLQRPDMAVYRAKLTSSGAVEKDGNALDLNDPDSEVKVEAVTEDGVTRLTFHMENPNQLYQMVYQTEITKLPSGGKAGNEIKLMGDDNLKNISAKSESAVDNSDVGISAGTKGLLALSKVDPNNKPLGGVEFTLYEPDGVTEVVKGTTGADGKLNMYIDKPGSYLLKQTYIDPTTYLPTTTIYQVRVSSTPFYPIWVDGVEVTSAKPLVVPTPVWETGDLKLDMAIEGKGASPTKDFEYIITFSNGKSYAYTGAANGTVASGGTVKLKGGQAITIKGIPNGITYTIVQKDYTGEGYTTDPANFKQAGSIVANNTSEAHFVNAKYLNGTLTIGETVAGNGGDKNKPFEFTVDFAGAGAGKTYSYTVSSGATGTIGSGGKLSLKHGETVSIDGIPKDTTYTVIQTDYTNDGYTTTWPDWQTTGTITDGGDQQELVVNTRMVYGGLLIGQTVEGSGADMNKEFEFTLQFPDAAAGQAYNYTKSDGTTGKVKSGDTITLKHGETAAVEGIPSGDSYNVTQTDPGEGYSVNPVSREYSGTIVEKQIAEARFVNAKYLPGNLTLTADPKVVPGNGKTPSQLTATLTDYAGKPVANQEVIFVLPNQSEIPVITNEEGKAVIPFIPPKLETATPEDHLITVKVDSLTEGQLSDTDTVTAVPAAITGVLRDNKTGEVIPNETVIITNETTGEEHTIKTDEAGVYFLPVEYGGEYTVSFTKRIDGLGVPITFKQKAEVDGNITGGDVVPADITAVGVVLLTQPDGQPSLLNSEFAGKLHIYLKDASGNDITDENGAPKAFSLQSNGSFSVDGLSAANYKMELRYEFEPGKELALFRDVDLSVKANGELNISQELVDPYGIITDAITGQVIEGAEVTLYYADTPDNKAKGIVPGTKVELPEIPGFEPNHNASPSQNSDVNGAYAYMVFPNTDYYLVVTKPGYETYTSPLIHVGTEIVKHDLQMNPLSSGGNGGGNNGGGGGAGPVTPGPDPVNPGPANPEPGNSVPGGSNSGTDNGNSGTDEGNDGAGNPDNGTNDGNPGVGNPGNGTDDGNTGNPDNGGVGNPGNETGNDNSGAGSTNNGAGGNNGTSSSDTDAGDSSSELDDVPATGDNSVSPVLYLALALMSLITIGIVLLGSKKNKQVQ